MSSLFPATEKDYTYYDILQLSRHGQGDWNRLSKDEIKAAYRRALLIHHPDKIPNNNALKPSTSTGSPQTPTPKYSIDDIVAAYETLVEPAKRAAYNQSLERSEKSTNGHSGTHIGVEAYDLEDLTYDEDKGVWSKGCRCSDEQGYIMTEQDLERESQTGEIHVGCRGCSLFIKVLFALEEA